jgi:hypothetical protein
VLPERNRGFYGESDALVPKNALGCAAMTQTTRCFKVVAPQWLSVVGACFLSVVVSACGGSVVRAGSGVGGLGSALSQQIDASAHSAEVCLLQDSLSPQNSGPEKSMTENCSKAQKNDLLYRRALQTLSLYGQRLSFAANGEEAETAGKLEAAAAGISGTDWSDADDQSTRDAVNALVNQMSTKSEGSKIDLNKVVQDAAPNVSTLCSNLNTHLDAQIKDLSAIRKDVDKKSQTRSIRRCGAYEGKTICVADTVVDRMVYAEVIARTAVLEDSSYDAKDGLSRFCTAHEKLAEFAKKDELGKKETYAAIVDAVKAVPRVQSQWAEPTAPKK